MTLEMRGKDIFEIVSPKTLTEDERKSCPFPD